MGKPLNSPAFFWPISLTSCVSKLFERIILSRQLFFLKFNSMLSPCQAGFCPEQSTLDQILFLSQSILDGFNKPRPSSRTILSTTDFLNLSTLPGIPPFSTNSIQLASLLALLVGLNLSFLIGALVWFIKITKVIPFEFVEVFCKDLFLALYFSLSSSMIFRLLCLLLSAALFTLTMWTISQEALFRLKRWLENWYLPLNLSKCEPSFFSVDPHQANLQPNFLLLGSCLCTNPTPTFLGVTFDCTLSFSKHVSSLKIKFFLHRKALCCISASSWGSSKESLSVLYKAFL